MKKIAILMAAVLLNASIFAERGPGTHFFMAPQVSINTGKAFSIPLHSVCFFSCGCNLANDMGLPLIPEDPRTVRNEGLFSHLPYELTSVFSPCELKGNDFNIEKEVIPPADAGTIQSDHPKEDAVILSGVIHES